MSVKKIQKKLIISLLILSVFLTGNCFGKFSLVRKIMILIQISLLVSREKWAV
jgi:uncharacterized membrane protein